jgi:hypothetical protein
MENQIKKKHNKNIYDLDLHESTKIYPNEEIRNIGYVITRVPGGWIYKLLGRDIQTFVPFHNGFKIDNVKTEDK